ncbi:protein kinase [Tieghemostelium lacteum]|uniref:Protein kinase n=1 Tax=Tieghemostelium lacteum TaxID=361077 RepID=A0A151ZCZ1_TIELA|nr:protein kinase [Tieghemostelium lacteum]|eukprot:KYQ91817.1 protein kinase [Tieghemostelium lacteum]
MNIQLNILVLVLFGLLFANSIQAQNCEVYVTSQSGTNSTGCGATQNSTLACDSIFTALQQCNVTTTTEITIILLSGIYTGSNGNSGIFAPSSNITSLTIQALNVSSTTPFVVVDLTNVTTPFVTVNANFSVSGISFINSTIAKGSSLFGSIVTLANETASSAFNVQVENSVISLNQGDYLFLFNGASSNQVTATFTNVSFAQNQMRQSVIWADAGSQSIVQSAKFSRNTGALYTVNSGEGSITNTQVLNNQVSQGGLITFTQATGTNLVSQVTFANNTFPGSVSGTPYAVVFSTGSKVNIDNSQFNDNLGACVSYNQGIAGQVLLSSTNFTGNQDQNQYAIVNINQQVSFSINNCNFNENTADSIIATSNPGPGNEIMSTQFISNNATTGTLDYVSTPSSNLTITEVLFNANLAKDAGAIVCSNTTIITSGLTLTENSPSGGKGETSNCGIDSSNSCILQSTNFKCTPITPDDSSAGTPTTTTTSTTTTTTSTSTTTSGSVNGSNENTTGSSSASKPEGGNELEQILIGFFIPIVLVITIVVIVSIYGKCKNVDRAGYVRINDDA